MRQALVAAAVLLLTAAAYALGVSRSDDEEPVAQVEITTTERQTTTVPPTTTERSTTTVPPTTTTEPPPSTTTTVPPTTAPLPPTTEWYPPQDSEVYSSDQPVCDWQCTEDILNGYGDPPPSPTTTQQPCRPSRYTACDPGEPMELPYGCDVLVETYGGDVKCAG